MTFEQQVSNPLRTWLVMAVFVVLLFFLGSGVDRFVVWEAARRRSPSGACRGWVRRRPVGMVAPDAGDRAVLDVLGGEPPRGGRAPADPTDDKRLLYRQLENVVDEMSIAAGLPRPRIYVIPDPDPNAFATGRDPAHASIAVTKGLLDTVNRDELRESGEAHEMSPCAEP